MRCDAATSYSNLIDKSKTTSGNDDDGDSNGRTDDHDSSFIGEGGREEGEVELPLQPCRLSVRPARKSEMLMESGDLIKAAQSQNFSPPSYVPWYHLPTTKLSRLESHHDTI